ncbi:PspA/IM30 family protein [Desulfonema magnum]|uniref:PspA/IM30 family protein domain-containing protein n=1 Tax=Desulfonema magnum TaxID=45655 RepID=A0A975GRA6_9BACT|nr:PspA/IM30 family protein [Desulfonema magnum]QTA90779.1 PspA/IM30 family protein domain-containing protein [Desulfonema magnum]
MKESISSRVRRIISGGIHQLIDAFENSAPEAVMESAILEVDGVIEDVRAELGKTLASKHMASKRLSEANHQHKELSTQIELAVRENREDLAEAAISRQLDIEAQIPVLESALGELNQKEKELEGFVRALRAKKREMKQELRQFRQCQAKSEVPASASPGENQGDDVQARLSRAESAFDRVLEKQTGLPGESTDLKTAAQLTELEKLVRKNRIQERLAAARTRMTDKV